MAPKPIPDRWLDYQPIGQRVKGTRFIAFKVPLREQVIASVKDDLRLSCESLLKQIPNIGMIIDLTNTTRYYDPYFFTKRGIRYEKLMIPGHEVPPANLVQMFKSMVRDYLRENANNNKLIGVHCTHGVNRTGYLICNFMISEMKIDPNEAMKYFEAARGHLIERQNYRNDLLISFPQPSKSHHTNWRLASRSPRQSKGFSIQHKPEERNRFSWRRSDRSSSPPRPSVTIHRNQEDNAITRKNPFRTRDPGTSHQDYTSFHRPSRPTDNSRRNYGQNDRKLYRGPENGLG